MTDARTKRPRWVLPVYVTFTTLLALAIFVGDVRWPTESPQTLFAWFGVSLVAEYLWVETIKRQGTVSLASAFNFATIFCLSRSAAVWIIGVSVLIATLAIQRRKALRTLFGFAQITVVTFCSSYVFTLLLGDRAQNLGGLINAPALGAMLVTFCVFFLMNTFAVSTAIALDQGESVLQVWRGNFAYWDEVKESLALFAISPLILIAYFAVGPAGFALFFLPLIVYRNATRRYIELERAQDSVVKTERLAAKGEMAAEIAHELNNSLTVLSGNAHLIEEYLGKERFDAAATRARSLRDQVAEMSGLTRGLMEFAHRNSTLQETDLAGLIERTVEFVRRQKRFDGVPIRLNLDARSGLVAVDAGQFQQVLVNLLCNAADSVRERGNGPSGIHVALRPMNEGRDIELSVTDEGVGIPAALLSRIFEPTFTTKADGHGFGLATCARIVQNHRGRITVESEVGVGATFQVVLPRARKSGTWTG